MSEIKKRLDWINKYRGEDITLAEGIERYIEWVKSGWKENDSWPDELKLMLIEEARRQNNIKKHLEPLDQIKPFLTPMQEISGRT